MQRVYGEFPVTGSTSADIVPAIKEYELTLNLNPVPDRFIIRKLGIKASAACTVAINGRDFTIGADETLEFGYDSIKITSIIFKTTGIDAVIRYMYFREDMVYQ